MRPRAARVNARRDHDPHQDGADPLFDPEPRLGFLAQARSLEARIDSGAVPAEKVAETRRLVFNNRLDAAVTGLFAGLILLLIAEAGFEWYRILSGREEAALRESPYVGTGWAEAK